MNKASSVPVLHQQVTAGFLLESAVKTGNETHIVNKRV